MISIVIPIHDMKGGAEFLWRSVNALTEQTYKDWELIITKEGKMAENTNAGIKRAKGDIIKVLYLDDMLGHKDALQDIVDAFEHADAKWLITSADDNPNPHYTSDIETGNNKLGSPSALAFRREATELFDETMSWLLDCDLYKRMFEKYGLPLVLTRDFDYPAGIIIGKGEHQMTHILTDQQKLEERNYLMEKYV